MNIASKVASRVVELVKNSWHGHGWTEAGGAEQAHIGNYTCLLASGYKAAYQEMEHIKEAKDLFGADFFGGSGGLNQTDPVMDLVERAMAQAIRELYPAIAKIIDPSGQCGRANLVMSFNDSHANKDMAVKVAERAKEIIEEHERMAEWVRGRKDTEIPTRFAFEDEVDETDDLSREIDELLAESDESLRKAESLQESHDEVPAEAERERARRKVQML